MVGRAGASLFDSTLVIELIRQITTGAYCQSGPNDFGKFRFKQPPSRNEFSNGILMCGQNVAVSQDTL